MRELRELQLPRLVEARKRSSTASSLDHEGVEFGFNPNFSLTQSSIASTESTPNTPTFSLRGHSRFPSSTSSLASSPNLHEHMDGYISKLTLSRVREESCEKESDSDNLENFSYHPEDLHGSENYTERPSSDLDLDEYDHYNWDDEGFTFDDGDSTNSQLQRSNDSSSGLGSTILSLGRKLKSKKESRSSSLHEALRENLAGRSRSNSAVPSRVPSLAEYRSDGSDMLGTFPLPPGSAGTIGETSVFRSQSMAFTEGEPEIEEEDEDEAAVMERGASTPLLPPVMIDFPKPEQSGPSPLQSPSASDSPVSPLEEALEVPLPPSAMASPHLSTKISTSSFQVRQTTPAEARCADLADSQDEWALKLGHANFIIHPQPYLPQLPASRHACERMRQDWNNARTNFERHLAGLTEIYAPTSMVHMMTQEKWLTIEQAWEQNYQVAFSSMQVAPRPTPRYTSANFSNYGMRSDAVLTYMGVNKKEQRFPTIAETGIIGKMEQAEPLIQRSHKRRFMKVLHTIMPSRIFCK